MPPTASFRRTPESSAPDGQRMPPLGASDGPAMPSFRPRPARWIPACAGMTPWVKRAVTNYQHPHGEVRAVRRASNHARCIAEGPSRLAPLAPQDEGGAGARQLAPIVPQTTESFPRKRESLFWRAPRLRQTEIPACAGMTAWVGASWCQQRFGLRALQHHGVIPADAGIQCTT